MTDQINDGGPAFPVQEDARLLGSYGMSLRDWFAGQALAGLLCGRHGDDFGDDWDIGADAYGIADALLAARTAGDGEKHG